MDAGDGSRIRDEHAYDQGDHARHGESRRCRLSTRKDLMSWMQFLLTYCERNQLSLSEVAGDDPLLELLNILWLRALD